MPRQSKSVPQKRKYTLAEAVAAVNEEYEDDDYSGDDAEFGALSEAVEFVTNDMDADIVLLPPTTVDSLSDEENIDDDNLLPAELPRDVPGPVAVHVKNSAINATNTKLVTAATTRSSSSKKMSVALPIWDDNVDFSKVIPCTSERLVAKEEQMKQDLREKTPYELFKLFYDDEVQNLIVNESVKYARQKNNTSFSLDSSDLDVFLGIMLLTGYHSLPRERMYWCRDEDIQITYVSSKMSRNRFSEIKKFLHVADNDKITAGDKIYKVRPLMDIVNRKLQQFGIFSRFLSIDEEMVPYFGHHSCKMFIRGKPIRFGFKLWVLASDNGYPFNVMVYTGKSHEPSEDSSTENKGLGFKVVTSLLSCLEDPSSHEVFFDNFFTSYDLLVYLQDINVKASGTARENRLKKCPLMNTSVMKKLERGVYDSKGDKRVSAVKWNDNQCVVVATNYADVNTMTKTKRWNSSVKKLVEVPQPTVVASYNAHMGGVDLVDRFLSDYRPVVVSKKWWWVLFSNFINLKMVAAWRLHVFCGGTFDQLSFRRFVVRQLMQSSRSIVPATGPSITPLDVIRYDGNGHFLESSNQLRCKLCKSNARLKCVKCNVHLHLYCAMKYHTPPQ